MQAVSRRAPSFNHFVATRTTRRTHSVARSSPSAAMGWTPNDMPSMNGKTALITGGYSGIGLETTRKLVEKGAKVYWAVRDVERGNRLAADLSAEFSQSPKIDVLKCDLASFSSVTECISTFRSTNSPLHLLINNAGVFFPGPYKVTEDGFEQSLGINYYGHMLLTLGLLDRVIESGPARIVFVASLAETFGVLDWNNLKGDKYTDSGLIPYSTTKLYLIMFAKELQSRLEKLGKKVDVFATNPGVVWSPLHEKVDTGRYALGRLIYWQARLLGQNQQRGAISTMHAATNPDVEGRGFKYYGPNNLQLWPTVERHPFNKAAHDQAKCSKLFTETMKILEEHKDVEGVIEHGKLVWQGTLPSVALAGAK